MALCHVNSYSMSWNSSPRIMVPVAQDGNEAKPTRQSFCLGAYGVISTHILLADASHTTKPDGG